MALTSSQQTWNPTIHNRHKSWVFRIIFPGMKINPKQGLKSTNFWYVLKKYDHFWACDQAIKIVPYWISRCESRVFFINPSPTPMVDPPKKKSIKCRLGRSQGRHPNHWKVPRQSFSDFSGWNAAKRSRLSEQNPMTDPWAERYIFLHENHQS